MKRKILIAWGNPYSFNESVAPLIPQLAEHFEIFLILSAYHLPPAVEQRLASWQREGVIGNWLVAPSHDDILAMHLFMRSKLDRLRRQNFDVFLAGSMMQVFERYLLDCVLPKHCVRACFCSDITYLLTHDGLARELLGVGGEKRMPSTGLEVPRSRAASLKRVVNKVLSRDIISEILFITKWIRKKIMSRLVWDPWKRVITYMNRYILPGFLVGRIFLSRRYDALTQLVTDGFEGLMFCDEIEANAHMALYRTDRVHVVQHPLQGNCRCQVTERAKTTILSPLSGFVGMDQLPDKALTLYCRDLKAVLNGAGASTIHLRLHPRESGRWPHQLQAYLRSQGMDAVVVGCDRPLREIVCDYQGVAGFSSCALRDARAACSRIFVVGFVGVSRYRYHDPKFVYGKGEGIGWIEEDGSYDPAIFQRNNYTAPQRPSVVEILRELKK